jgi:hypothetical protein
MVDLEELLCSKEYKPFKVFIYTQPEDIDVADIFDADAFDTPNVDEIRTDINNGNKIWVMARAVAYCKGVELGFASMGGLLYDSYESLKKDILNDEHDIIHEALKEARGSLKTLKAVTAPAEEQLTSQFMEGQVW